MDAAELCLTWDDHHNALLRVFEELLQSNTLVDCTIAAEGQYLKAHKVVLSACSPYFQMLFSQENEKNPIVVLKDMKFQELKAVIEFVYRGQVKVLDTELEQFLGAAESLQIRGLANHQKKKTPEHIASNDPLPQERSPSPPVPRKRRRTSPPQVREEDIVSQRGIVHNDNNTVDIGIGEVPVDIHVPSSAVPSSSSAAVSTSSAAPRKYSSNRDQTRTRQPSYPPLVEVLSDTETVIKTEPEPDPEPEPMTEVFVAETKNEEYSDEMQLLDSGDGNAGPSSSDVSAHQSISQFPASSPVFDTAEDPFLTSQIGEQSGAQGQLDDYSVMSDETTGAPTQIEEKVDIVHHEIRLSKPSTSAAVNRRRKPTAHVMSDESKGASRQIEVKLDKLEHTIQQSEPSTSAVNRRSQRTGHGMSDESTGAAQLMDEKIDIVYLKLKPSDPTTSANVNRRGKRAVRRWNPACREGKIVAIPGSSRPPVPAEQQEPSNSHHSESGHLCDNSSRSRIRGHTGKRRFQCKYCSRSYKKRDSLNNHLRVHTNDRPYVCSMCGASFTRLWYLNTHKRAHTGERPFQCNECGKSFSQKGNLNSHIKKVHSNDL